MKEPNKQYISYIFREYQAKLRNFISQRISSPEDTEDILQNVFYQFSRTDSDETPIQQISAWLYTVTRHQIIDWYKKKKESPLPDSENPENEDQWMDNLSVWLADEESSPETGFLRKMVWEELELALQALPAEQSSVFRLTELEGFSFKEISDSTGLPVNTLISRKRYAVLYLRKRLTQLYEELLE